MSRSLSRSPVVYFYDLGLRNFVIGLFGRLIVPAEMGFLFENLVLNLIQDKFPHADIHFWRTSDGAEVDFIIELPDRIIPVEVKFKDLKERKIGRSLKSFVLKYSPPEAWIVNLSLQGEEKLEGVILRFMPFWELL